MRTVYRADLLFKLHSPLGRRLGHNDERWDGVKSLYCWFGQAVIQTQAWVTGREGCTVLLLKVVGVCVSAIYIKTGNKHKCKHYTALLLTQ